MLLCSAAEINLKQAQEGAADLSPDHADAGFSAQIAFVAGTEYTTVQLISVAVTLCTQIRGAAYTISPAMVNPQPVASHLEPVYSVQTSFLMQCYCFGD